MGDPGSHHSTRTGFCLFLDGLVFIQQFSLVTASLNVSVAASIVLHHYATWAQFAHARVEGQKFAEAKVEAGPASGSHVLTGDAVPLSETGEGTETLTLGLESMLLEPSQTSPQGQDGV